jgi:hypothetical protein
VAYEVIHHLNSNLSCGGDGYGVGYGVGYGDGVNF